MLTDVGPAEITVPRDRDGSSEPKIVKKRQKRLTGVDEIHDVRIPEEAKDWLTELLQRSSCWTASWTGAWPT